MVNGFYDVDNLTEETKRALIDDAIKTSFLVRVETKYKNNSMWRELDKDLTIQQVIDGGFKSSNNNLIVVNRSIYNRGEVFKCDSEVVLHYDWTFLYCIMTHENVDKLALKYELKLLTF